MLVASLLLGATACAGMFFFLHWRSKESLMERKSASVPTESLPGSAAGGAETPADAAAGEKAETAAEAVRSARDGSGEERSAGGAATGEVPPEEDGSARTGLESQIQLLDLLDDEARRAIDRMAAENGALRRRIETLEARNRNLAERLAEAMAALDRERTGEMPEAEAERGGIPPEGARLLAVSPELGLVVLDLGARDGLRHGMPFTVLRGQRPVARVRTVDLRERTAGAVIVETAADAQPRTGDRAVPTRTADSEGK